MQTQKLIHFKIQIQKRGAQKTWSKIGQETVFVDLSNSVRKLGAKIDENLPLLLFLDTSESVQKSTVEIGEIRQGFTEYGNETGEMEKPL